MKPTEDTPPRMIHVRVNGGVGQWSNDEGETWREMKINIVHHDGEAAATPEPDEPTFTGTYIYHAE